MIRATGYYWVKYGGSWIIAHWHDLSKESNNKTRDNWQMCGYSDWFGDRDFQLIGKEMHFAIEENEALKNHVKMYQGLLEVSTGQKMELVDENKTLNIRSKFKNFLWFMIGLAFTCIAFVIIL